MKYINYFRKVIITTNDLLIILFFFNIEERESARNASAYILKKEKVLYKNNI